MIGYAFSSIGFGPGDLLLFAFSILTWIWAVRTWRRGKRSLALKFVTVAFMVLGFVPFVLLGSAFLAAKFNAPAAITAQPVPGSQEIAMNMGSSINTQFREAEPSFTADGRTMYFNCYDADICVSHLIGTWEEGKWTTPKHLGAPISTGYFEVEPLVNATGDKLYFQSNRPARRLHGNPLLSPFVTNSFFIITYLAEAKLGVSIFDGFGLGDVWVSYKVNGVWSEPQNLNDVPGEPSINTAFHDHCLSFSTDGNEAFWTSTRPGGFGGNDIWTSRRVSGQWTVPENLGPNVNGPGDEHHSMPTPDGKSLYVTTMREGDYGGEDNYITTRDAEGKWGALVNLGPLINGPDDDRCPASTPDGKVFLFDSTRSNGFGGMDIWWVYFKDVKGYPMTAISVGGTSMQSTK
jgi:WD40-like Beta Propeller Repeat